jgi:hypothetical protein
MGPAVIMADSQFDVPTALESETAQRKMLKDTCDAAWNRFPELEGTHWALRTVERRVALVTSDDGMLLATIDEASRRSSFSLLFMPVREVRVAGGLVYRLQRLGGHSREESQVVEADSGLPVLRIAGHHYNGRAGGTIQVLSERGQAAVGSGLLRFPVEGTKPQNALMSVADDSGRTILRFRVAYSIKPRQGGPRPWMTLLGLNRPRYQEIEVLLSPGLKVVPELLLIAAFASPWISSYFHQAGAAG